MKYSTVPSCEFIHGAVKSQPGRRVRTVLLYITSKCYTANNLLQFIPQFTGDTLNSTVILYTYIPYKSQLSFLYANIMISGLIQSSAMLHGHFYSIRLHLTVGFYSALLGS